VSNAGLTLGDVVRRFGPAYVTAHGATMPPSHRRALRALSACRTAALGGHVTQCEHCGAEHYVYHSCRHRSCPTCHGAATAAWLAARTPELLPVPYFHLVFTLPSELRLVVRQHQRVLLGALMTTAVEALQALAADPRYVGGRLGVLAVLHTWTRALVYHPHVHCLVPGGGLAADGLTWRSARRQFLVPVRALGVGFRARFLRRLRAVVPDGVLPATVWQQLWDRPWVVYAKPTVQGPTSVLRYLARYVHRAAITNARLRGMTRETVTFDYRDAERRGWRTMTLRGEEFLRRVLTHVLPSGFHKVRCYGLWTPGHRTTRAVLQVRLAELAPPPPALTSGAAGATLPRPLTGVCAACGQGPVRRIASLPALPMAAIPPP